MVYNTRGGDVVATEEQVGYEDAIRQVRRALERRLHHVKDQLKDTDEADSAREMRVRIGELEHALKIVDSLHR
jgi:ribosome-associated translation inhibitor RaiA